MSRRSLAPLLALVLLPFVAAPAEATAVPPEQGRDAPRYTFIAAPDFLNQDVGDVRRLPTWRPGLPNSWTPELQQGIDRFLDEIEARDPGAVLVAGDLVEGHWGRDDERTGLFGPTRTERQKVRALRRAADFYYGIYARRFTQRGLTLHAAVGDHDIGDNPWGSVTAWSRFKRRNLGVFKDEFAQHFTRTHGRPKYRNRPVGSPWADTAYATRLDKEVLLVTLDEFHRTRRNVRFEVVGAQLRWLRATLKQARRDGIEWVIVQGHNPILWPVRSRFSSDGHMIGGARSRLWRTMARYGADLYLNGEVHDTTLRRNRGLTQISTGGLVYNGQATYLTAEVYGGRLDLEVHEFLGDAPPSPLLWQTSGPRTRSLPEYPTTSTVVGSVTIRSDGRAVRQTGKLVEYRR